VIKTSFWHCLGPLIIQKWQNNELSNRYYFFKKIKKLESFFKNENFGIFFDDFVWKLVVIDKNGAFLTSKCVLLAQIPLLKNIFFAVNRHLECTVCPTSINSKITISEICTVRDCLSSGYVDTSLMNKNRLLQPSHHWD